jgi:hypothetical protein
MWLNVDKPTKKATFHEDTCTYIPTRDSKYKKLNGFLRDGGWLHFDNKEKAIIHKKENYPDYVSGHCSTCE